MGGGNKSCFKENAEEIFARSKSEGGKKGEDRRKKKAGLMRGEKKNEK